MVGFNVKRFDYRVLSGYSTFDFNRMNTLDILEDIYDHLGFRMSLAHLAEVTLDTQKTADGLQALQWWKEGRMDEIVAYCRQDVRITRDLYLFGKNNGYLLFNTKAGETIRIPMKWLIHFVIFAANSEHSCWIEKRYSKIGVQSSIEL